MEVPRPDQSSLRRFADHDVAAVVAMLNIGARIGGRLAGGE